VRVGLLLYAVLGLYLWLVAYEIALLERLMCVP
jgi:hypothetical protein